MMQASAPLLQFAIPKTDGILRDYYVKHLSEETGHDAMLERDLLALGVTEIPRYHDAAKIAGSQYYLIAHEHPASLLGYMHVLEKNAFNENDVAELEKLHGVTLECLRHHAKHDPHHVAELEEQITLLPVDVRGLAIWNAKCVFESLKSIFGKMGYA